MAVNNLPPCFKYKPSRTMPSTKPLYGSKYSPWPSVSTLAIFEHFFKYNTFPIALFVTFCPKADLTVPQSPMLGERSLPKMAGPLWLNQLTTKGTRPLFWYCEQPDVYSFLLWCLFHSDNLLSFCSLVNWSKQEHHHHKDHYNRHECSRDSLYQRRVSIIAVNFMKF